MEAAENAVESAENAVQAPPLNPRVRQDSPAAWARPKVALTLRVMQHDLAARDHYDAELAAARLWSVGGQRRTVVSFEQTFRTRGATLTDV